MYIDRPYEQLFPKHSVYVRAAGLSLPVPVSYTHLDVYKRQPSLQYAKNYLNLRQLSFAIDKILHTDTFWKTTFLYVLRIVQSESAIISNTIFSRSSHFHFLTEHGSKKKYFVVMD